MSQKLRPAIIAFSGLIIYSALCISLGYLPMDDIYVRLIAKCFIILLGSVYIKTVLRYPPVFDKPSVKYVMSAAVAIVIFVFASLFTSLWFVANTSLSEVTYASDHILLSVFISVVLTPVAEELIFRGFMYGQLAYYNKTIALVISTIVFALYHGTFIHLYTATLGGLILCCIYAKTKKLRYSIVFHSLFNALTMLLSLVDYADWFSSSVCVLLINIACVISIIVLFVLKAYDKPYYENNVSISAR